MPTEGANSISELDPANPDSNAPAGEGDDQLRQLKSVLQTSFPALDGLITNSGATGDPGDVDPPDAATFSRLFTDVKAAASASVPVGAIMMWAGAENDIPDGWALCNGQNNTPDLRNRFILAADYDTSVYNVGTSGGEAWNTTDWFFPILDGASSLDASVTLNGDTGTTNVAVKNEAHKHWYVPPFFALAYIQFKGT